MNQKLWKLYPGKEMKRKIYRKKYSEIVKGNSGLFYWLEFKWVTHQREFKRVWITESVTCTVVCGKIHKGTLAPPTPRATEWFILFWLWGCDFLFIHSLASQPGGNIGAELKGTVNTLSMDTCRFCAVLEAMEAQLQSHGGHRHEKWIHKLNDTVVSNDSFRTNFPQRLPL